MYTPSHTLFSSSHEKTLRAWITDHLLYRLTLSETTFLLTSYTAVLSHSPELLLKPFSLFISAYSELLFLSQALEAVHGVFGLLFLWVADVFTDFLGWVGGRGVELGERERGRLVEIFSA